MQIGSAHFVGSGREWLKPDVQPIEKSASLSEIQTTSWCTHKMNRHAHTPHTTTRTHTHHTPPHTRRMNTHTDSTGTHTHNMNTETHPHVHTPLTPDTTFLLVFCRPIFPLFLSPPFPPSRLHFFLPRTSHSHLSYKNAHCPGV